jgi:hypothetical protein
MTDGKICAPSQNLDRICRSTCLKRLDVGRLEVGTECGSHRRQQGVYVAMSQVLHVTIARCGSSNSTHSGLRCGCCSGYRNGNDAHCRWHRRHQSPCHQWQSRRGANRVGAPKCNDCSQHSTEDRADRALLRHRAGRQEAVTTNQQPGNCLASGDGDDETNEFTFPGGLSH